MITNKTAIPLGIVVGLLVGSISVILWAQNQHDCIKADVEGKIAAAMETRREDVDKSIQLVQQEVLAVKEDVAEVKADVNDIERTINAVKDKQAADNAQILLLLMQIKDDQ